MVIIKDKSYLIKTRVLVGQFFGAAPEDGYIELCEPDNFDSNRLAKASREAKDSGDSEAMLELFRGLLPRIIVDHSLYESEDKKKTAEAVAEIVLSKVDLLSFVLEQYSREVLFSLGKKSDGK